MMTTSQHPVTTVTTVTAVTVTEREGQCGKDAETKSTKKSVENGESVPNGVRHGTEGKDWANSAENFCIANGKKKNEAMTVSNEHTRIRQAIAAIHATETISTTKEQTTSNVLNINRGSTKSMSANIAIHVMEHTCPVKAQNTMEAA